MSILVLGTSLAFLGYGLYANWSEMSRYEWRVSFPYLAACILAYPIPFALLTWGWKSIMTHVSGYANTRKHLEVYGYSNLTKRLPGTFWYIPGRMYMYEPEGVSRNLTLAATIMEINFVLFSGAVVGVVAMPFYLQGNQIALVVSLGLGLAAGYLALFPDTMFRLGALLLRRGGGGQLTLSHIPWSVSLRWVLVYCVTWLFGGLVLFLMINTVYPFSYGQLPAIVGLWSISGVAGFLTTFIPSGIIGVREVALSVLLGQYMPFSVAVLTSIAYRVFLTLGEVVGILLLLAACRYFRAPTTRTQ